MEQLDDLFEALADLATAPGDMLATSMRQPAALRRAAHLAVGLGMDDSVTAATNRALEQRVRRFARQHALAAHLDHFPTDRPSLAAVARRRVSGTGHPAERRPEILDDIAGWVERREPDWLLTNADETVDHVLRVAEMIVDGVGAPPCGAA